MKCPVSKTPGASKAWNREIYEKGIQDRHKIARWDNYIRQVNERQICEIFIYKRYIRETCESDIWNQYIYDIFVINVQETGIFIYETGIYDNVSETGIEQI